MPLRQFSLFFLLAASGCASAWSEYDDSLYQALRAPGPESYAAHAALLERIVEEARSAGRAPPPGIFAERGIYLARTGRAAEAKRCFQAEKETYPESAAFVAILERLAEGRRSFSPEP